MAYQTWPSIIIHELGARANGRDLKQQCDTSCMHAVLVASLQKRSLARFMARVLCKRLRFTSAAYIYYADEASPESCAPAPKGLAPCSTARREVVSTRDSHLHEPRSSTGDMKNSATSAYILLLGTFIVSTLPAAAGDCDYKWLFDCGNGACVDPYKVCDNVDHCGNGADESDCTGDVFVCPPCAFACHNGTQCTLPRWVCDNANDCHDGSDEKNCPEARAAALNCALSRRPQPTSASPLEDTTLGDVSSTASPPARSCNITDGDFPCLDGRCLLPVQVCDGVTDCSDGADEGRFCQLIQQRNQRRQEEEPQELQQEQPQHLPQHQPQQHPTKQQQRGFRGWLLDLSFRMLFKPLQDSSNLTSRE